MATSSSPPPASGLERPGLDAWLEAHTPLRAPLEMELIAGGRSNLTYLVRDAAGTRAVLRRPPLGAVLQSAHDVGREHRIISALSPTVVPVPAALAHCEDPDVNGAPFYVMDHVDGAVVRDADDARERLDARARAAVGPAMVDVLADLHALEPAAVGLGTLGRPTGYLERQLRRWQAQWEQARTTDVPAVDEAGRRLRAAAPAQARTSIVHGDFRIDNLVLGEGGDVRAVLDWELCTLGDPLADVGMLLLYWLGPDEPADHLLSGVPTTAGGFAGRDALAARYAERSGQDLSVVDYHVAFAAWKLACIAAGIAARYRAGAMGGDDGAAAARPFEAKVGGLAEAALAVLDGRG